MPSLATTMAHLGDTKRPLQHKELRLLNDIGAEAEAEFRAAWDTIDEPRRREIASALTTLAEENVEFDFRDVFSAMLDDPEPEVRIAAIDGLWEDERLRTLRRLEPLLANDPDDDVRASAALALGRFAYRASLDELPARVARDVRAALFKTAGDLDASDEVRRRAIEGVGYYGGDDAIALLGQAYTSGRQALKESAIVAMGRTMDPRWLPIIAAELGSSEAALRYEAARAAGEMAAQATDLLGQVLQLAEGDDSEVAQAAIWALGQIGGEGARRNLRRLSKSDDPAVQQAAEEALGELQIDQGSFGLL